MEGKPKQSSSCCPGNGRAMATLGKQNPAWKASSMRFWLLCAPSHHRSWKEGLATGIQTETSKSLHPGSQEYILINNKTQCQKGVEAGEAAQSVKD